MSTPPHTAPSARPRVAAITGAALLLLLSGCGNDSPSTPPGPAPVSAPFTLPADMPPLNCADIEPAPVAKPAEKLTGRQCTTADGTTKWINGFYECTDGRIWPVLGTVKVRPEEPTGPEFDKCSGR